MPRNSTVPIPNGAPSTLQERIDAVPLLPREITLLDEIDDLVRRCDRRRFDRESHTGRALELVLEILSNMRGHHNIRAWLEAHPRQ